MIVTRRDGSVWLLGEPVATSDGYLIAYGTMLDPDSHEPALDEYGLPLVHDFFLGGER